jgi:hypothetical protein
MLKMSIYGIFQVKQHVIASHVNTANSKKLLLSLCLHPPQPDPNNLDQVCNPDSGYNQIYNHPPLLFIFWEKEIVNEAASQT